MHADFQRVSADSKIKAHVPLHFTNEELCIGVKQQGGKIHHNMTEVDVICTATAGRLMKKGVAENLFVKEGSPKSVYDFIKDAHEAGAKFYCCSPNLDLFDMTTDDLIPECEGIVGGAHLIEEVMEEDCKVLTY